MFLRLMRLAGCGGSFEQVRDKPKRGRARHGNPNAPRSSDGTLGPSSGTMHSHLRRAYLWTVPLTCLLLYSCANMCICQMLSHLC